MEEAANTNMISLKVQEFLTEEEALNAVIDRIYVELEAEKGMIIQEEVFNALNKFAVNLEMAADGIEEEQVEDRLQDIDFKNDGLLSKEVFVELIQMLAEDNLFTRFSKKEMEAIQEAIPEWKRSAIVISELDDDDEHIGMLKRALGKAGSKIGSTKFIKNLSKSEEFSKFRKGYVEVKEDMTDFREKLKDNIETTENRAVGVARDVGTVVFNESTASRATRVMRKFDPDFDLIELHHEAEEIFLDFFNAFLSEEYEYLKKFTGD